MKNQKGITIIALIITIILMLILATISVNVAINGGLFEKASDAVDSAEIANEKDTVVKANILAKSKNKIVTVKDVQKALNNITGENAATAMDNGDSLVVKFNDSNRYYEIETSGKVEGPKELVKEDYAGDLSKGNKYDGTTEATAFRIACIEDLVEFSKNYTKYNKGYIKLERTLDFKSIFSYNDYTSKAYGDLNGDGNIDDIRTELTKQGENCAGFPTISQLNAEGTFDGQNNKICNLYQNTEKNHAGLFYVSDGTIKNLGLKNINIKEKSTVKDNWGYTGGIASVTWGNKVENCYVEGKITIKTTTTSYVGVLVGRNDSGMENCYTVGTLELDTSATLVGGITGFSGGSIKRCYNIMDIKCSSTKIGGITAKFSGEIEECFHIGDITGVDGGTAVGLIGEMAGGTMKNCYNIGNINGKGSSAGMAGWYCKGDFFNCYSVGEMTATGGKGAIINNCYGRACFTLFCKKRRRRRITRRYIRA